jgi:hypothetical protein
MRTIAVGDETERATRQKSILWITPDSLPHWVTAVFTLALVVLAYCAWDESKRGTKAFEGQLDQMKEQLTELRNEQRPWVALSDIKAVAPKSGEAYVIAVTIINAGKTPALKTRAIFVANLLSKAEPPPLMNEPCLESVCGQGEVFFPNVPANRSAIIPAHLISQAFQSISKGEELIWLRGRIDYAEMHGTPHYTRVCYTLNLEPPRFVACNLVDSNGAN